MENVMETVRLSSKGQLVIPKKVRERLGIAPGAVLDVRLDGQTLVLTPRRRSPQQALLGSLGDYALLEELTQEREREREKDAGR
jgi:AbrB family looped-hinge helix DNA binding protein